MTDSVQQKLMEAKDKVKLFALDYDGTIYGEGYDGVHADNLLVSILKSGKSLAVITARAATAVKAIYPGLKDFYKHNSCPVSFIGGGNGTILYEVGVNGLKKIYSYGMSTEETKRNLSLYNKIYSDLKIKSTDLNPKGIATFNNFLSQNWHGYIPEEFIDLCRNNGGKYFAEEAKTTFVLPADKNTHPDIINKVQLVLGDDYAVKAGDSIYCHITKSLAEDPKKTAVKTILARMNLSDDNVVAFGDMPQGNDEGLLSFPYSFTNALPGVSDKNILKTPPYILRYKSDNPVAKVYKAIGYLLG